MFQIFGNLDIIIIIINIKTLMINDHASNSERCSQEESLARRRQTSTRVGEDEEEATGTESK